MTTDDFLCLIFHPVIIISFVFDGTQLKKWEKKDAKKYLIMHQNLALTIH